MIRKDRGFYVLAAVFLAVVAWAAYAQNGSDGGLVVSEDLLVDTVVQGEEPAANPPAAEEPKPVASEEAQPAVENKEVPSESKPAASDEALDEMIGKEMASVGADQAEEKEASLPPAAEAAVSEAKAETSAAQAETTEAKAETAEARAATTDAKAATVVAQEETADVVTEVADAQAETIKAEAETLKAQEDASEAKAEVTEAKAETVEAEAATVEAKVEASEAQVAATEAEAETVKAQEETAEAKAEVTEAKAETVAAEAEASEAQVAATEAEAETVKAQEETAEAKAETSEAQAEVTEAKAETVEAEVETAAAKAETVEAKTEAAAVVAPQAPVVAGDQRSAIAHVADSEILRRQAEDSHGRETLKAAQEALRTRQYDKAVPLFVEAAKYLRRPESEPQLRMAKGGLAETYYRWASFHEKNRDYKAGLEVAEKARVAGHPKGEALVLRMKNYMEHPPVVEVKPERTPVRWKQKELKDKESQIGESLKRGRAYYQTREYDKAQQEFEGVLKLDPQNTEAIRLMQKVTQRKYDIATQELDATRRDMMAELRKTWNPRDYALVEDVTSRNELEGVVKLRPEGEKVRLDILKKMENIVLPEINFTQANIYSVIEFLQQASVEFDTSDDPKESKGVNIILNIVSGAPPAPKPAEGGGDFSAAAASSGVISSSGEEVPLITFTARYISLLEALKIVTSISNLKFRVEGKVVMVLPINAAIGQIYVRMYDVLPSVEEKIPTMRSELGTSGGQDSEFRSMEAGTTASEATDWKSFFREMGVQWPDGSSIKYVKSIGKIVVANTVENLAAFEDVLAVLNVVPNQIEIEARFVEVTQSDASAVGLEWLLTDDWELAQKKGGGTLATTERVVVRANSGTTSPGFTKGNRFVSQLSQESGGIADNVLSVAGILTNPELEVVLHLLEQRGFADLLSAPKVTTKAGQEATIKVVTEYIYPTDFTVTPITTTDESGNATVAGGVVEPGSFETREVGVILQVTPDVSPEGQMINLVLAPQVVNFERWMEYGSSYTDPSGNTQTLNMQQPFFHTRTVNTSISIYNGATVVMGGMITEVRQNVNDKVPVFGDIPLIGRLFQSKYETSEKRNLLIFVTARLVDPAGRPLEKARARFAERAPTPPAASAADAEK